MDKVREVIAYQNHFENFLRKQTDKVQNKIYKVIEVIETLERVPETGRKGTSRRDELERDFESFKIGVLLKKAREDKNLTQEQLAELVDKKRTYISRVENNGSNLTLKTLFDIVEKGLGGKVKISIEL